MSSTKLAYLVLSLTSGTLLSSDACLVRKAVPTTSIWDALVQQPILISILLLRNVFLASQISQFGTERNV